MTDLPTWTRLARWLIGLVALLLLALAVRSAAGQSVRAGASAGVEVWAGADRCFQNRLSASGRVEVKWGIARAEVFMSGLWWGSCDAKVPGSLLNAEAGRVIERKHGASLYGQWHGAKIGVIVHRRAIHHIWRHADRHEHFPGSWQVGRRASNGKGSPSWPPGKPQKPSIGYWDGARLLVGYATDAVSARLLGPLLRWKTHTLPWPKWMLEVGVRHGAWTFEASGQAGAPAGWALDVGVRRELIGPVEVGLRAGQIASPLWATGNLRRVTTTITVD